MQCNWPINKNTSLKLAFDMKLWQTFLKDISNLHWRINISLSEKVNKRSGCGASDAIIISRYCNNNIPILCNIIIVVVDIKISG